MVAAVGRVVLRFRRLALTLLLFALPACGVSPQPSPPNLDVDSMAEPPTGGVGLPAFTGRVDPPEGVVVVIHLDGDAPPRAEPVAADGRFSVTAIGPIEDEHRVQARVGAARSAPVDLVGEGEPATLRPAPRPLADCFVTELELDFGDVPVGGRLEQRVTVTNDCGEPLTFAPARLRTDGPFEIVSAPTALADGEAAELVVAATPTAPGPAEGIVFLESTAPMADRRPISLFVDGRD